VFMKERSIVKKDEWVKEGIKGRGERRQPK